MSAEMNVAVKTVCSHPPGCGADAVTADGHVIAFCPESDGRVRFLWDGVAGAPFDGLVELRDKSTAVFSSEDGAHVAYVGRRGEKVFVGRDNREEPPFDAFSGSVPPTFGGGGRHLAYAAQVPGGDFRLIVDGEPMGTTSVAPIAAVFSPDGERLAYVEMRGEGRGEIEHRIVLDGREGDWFRGMRNATGAMQFSPDGRRFAYYAIDGKGHARWFLDVVAQRLVNDVRPLGLTRIRGIAVLDPALPARFSPDSQRFAYFADVVEKGVAIVEDDVPGPLFRGVGLPVFSPDSRHLAYAAETSPKKMTLVLDGAMSGEWPATSAGEPIFSPDSRRVAVTLQRDEGGFLRKRQLYTVAVDGRSYPEEPGDDVSLRPAFSPDGARVAWWLQRGTDSVLVIDGVVHLGAAFVGSDLRFDPSGRIVHASRFGTSHTISVDDRPGPLADAVVGLFPASEVFSHRPWPESTVPFRLSADGLHVAWAGLFGDQMCPVLDDEVGPTFDLIIDCRFDDDGAAVWWAMRGEVVFRVERAPAAGPMRSGS